MKNAVRFLLCLLLAAVLLFPVCSFAALGQDLNYGSGEAADLSLLADELFDLLFAGETPLTEFERTYLRSKETLTLSYSTADLPANLVSWNYDGEAGTLTISASPFRYTSQNGESVVWVPQTVALEGGEKQPLSQSGASYICICSGVWNSGSTDFTVEYAWTVALDAVTADEILTGAFPQAKEIRDRLDAFAIDHAEWVEQTERYAAYCAELEPYRKAYRRWEQKKQEYDAYLAAKAEYDERVAEYEELSAAWEAYNNYQRANAEYAAAMEQYGAYARTMQEIDNRLAIMEVMFTPTTDGNNWTFYPSMMGGSVDIVLENGYKLVTQARVEKKVVTAAQNATQKVRPLLERYATARSETYETEFEKTRALFEIYTEIYEELRLELGNLSDSMINIYTYPLVQSYMEGMADTRDNVPHFQQFLSLMYVLQALLDDFETVDLNYALPRKPDKIVGNLVEPALRPADTNSADPVGIVFPETFQSAPVAPTYAPKPERETPPDPAIYGAPEPVEDPGAAPEAPAEVANPGAEPTIAELTPAEETLLAQYDAGLLPERTAKGEEQTLVFTKTITQTATYQNKRTVVFQKLDGGELERRTVEYGDPVSEPPRLADYQTEQYLYTFLGWIAAGSNATKPLALDCIQTDLSLSPLFSREKRTYPVTWKLWNSSVTVFVEYGELPVPPETPTRPDDDTFFYRFAGWSPAVLPVSGSATYTAGWQAFPLFCEVTWDTGAEQIVSSVAYGELPAFAGVPEKEQTTQYTYVFLGWSPEVTATTENTTYTALWEAHLRSYPVTWIIEGEETTRALSYGTLPEYPGTPEKEPTAQYSYTFLGWSPEVGTVTGNQTYTALWEEHLRSYTVTWGIDGAKTTQTLPYGTLPEYTGTPEKAPDAQYTYTFLGWSPEVGTVTGNQTYTALWEAHLRSYTVTWSIDGVKTTQTLPYGAIPEYDGTPEKEQTAQYTYTFSGWSPKIGPVKGDQTYTAVWKKTLRSYTVTWSIDGVETVQTLAYGTTPAYEGTPEKADDELYSYTFRAWTPKISRVTRNVTYTAVWDAELLEKPIEWYTVTWDLGDGEQITAQVATGELPAYTGTPEKAQDAQYTYTFLAWSPEPVAVTENTTYTALWEEHLRSYTVTWEIDGIETARSVAYGEAPAYEGTPEKEQTAQYTYTFLGWSPALTVVTENATYTALWEEHLRSYPITWNIDGKEIVQTVAYGETPAYEGTPEKAQTAQYTYTFLGWSPEVDVVTGSQTYTALWEAHLRSYPVTWVVDGTETTRLFAYGEIPAYEETPEKEQTAQYTYTFLGWSPALTAVTGNATYTALWEEHLRSYPVTWNIDGKEIIQTVAYGEVPAYSGTPEKAQTAQYTYTFLGWSPEPVAVTESATYTALWEEHLRFYPVTWNIDGVETTRLFAYGETPAYEGTPEKAQDERYAYTFAGWSPEVGIVTGSQTYTALWSATLRLYTVTWDLGNGNTTTVSVSYGELPHYNGTPEKAQTAQYTYTFLGWSPEPVAVTEDTTYTALWKETVRSYPVTWVVDGTETTRLVAYGRIPAYGGTPEKAQDERYTYTFLGWSPVLTAVTGSTTYTAEWKAEVRLYTVTWDLGNGVTKTDLLPYGASPAYEGTPEREQDDQFTYTFLGWSPTLTAVNKNATYTALWGAVPRFYTVTWEVDGKTETASVPNGEVPVFNGTPEKARDEQFTYTFIGWSPELAPATANAAYTALWQKSPLIKDAEGNPLPTQTTDDAVVVDAAEEELDLKNAIDFAADEGKTVTLEREGTTVTLDAETLKEQLPELDRIRWVDEEETGRFCVDFVDAEGKTLQTELTYRVSLSYAENQILTIYEEDGEELHEIPAYHSVDAAGRLASFSVPAGKTVVFKVKYRLTYESDEEYYSTLPAYAESGENISLDADCKYGYEVSGATLVHENGEVTEVGNSFEMPAEALTVRLHITPIVYHIVFVCGEETISERDYQFGETIVIPEDPVLSGEENEYFVFRGWSPQVSETATGEAREVTYRAIFIFNPPQEEVDLKLWAFFISPIFFYMVIFVVVIVPRAIVLVVLLIRFLIRRVKKKKADKSPKTE